MAFRDVLALVTDGHGDDAAIAAARQLAALNGAARVFLMQIDPEPSPAVAYYVRGDVWAEMSARAREGLADQEEELRHRLARLDPPVKLSAGRAMARDVRARAEIETRCADINVMIRPSADSGRLGAAGRALFEGALFGGGRSLLLVPQDWRGPPIGQNVVIAWRNRREAARAVADASPLLDVARDICVMSVGEQARGLYSVSEEDVAAHLGRRGLKAHAEWRAGDNEGEVLLKACADAGADLLVMGGFGRAQWRETLLGGVTQTVLASARLPVLMSH